MLGWRRAMRRVPTAVVRRSLAAGALALATCHERLGGFSGRASSSAALNLAGFKPAVRRSLAAGALALATCHERLGGFSVRASSSAALASLKPQAPLTAKLTSKYENDVIVIGGGSGGLAAAREIAALSGKAMLFDYVQPSPQGTKWGIGGTCVNVGCIPKKLMHNAALLGEGLIDAMAYGWEMVPERGGGGGDGDGAAPATAAAAADDTTVRLRHNWQTLTAAVANHIKGTNWGYRNALRDERVEYVNAHARMVDGHTVEYRDPKTKAVKTATAAHIIIAVGGRPKYPEGLEGALELGITSDDLFWLPEPPGKTLLVGAGYVALECAGFLTGLGYEATVMARGQVLRGFDADIARRIVSHMEATGTRFLRGSRPVRLEKIPPLEGSGRPHRVRVHFAGPSSPASGSSAGETTQYEDFDTVVLATGRAPVTAGLGLELAGVAVDAGGKIVGGGSRTTPTPAIGATAVATRAAAAATSGAPHAGTTPNIAASLSRVAGESSVWSETTTVPSVHAVGDVLSGTPELTPVAIRAGRLLARRIMTGVLPTDGATAAAEVAGAAADGGTPWAGSVLSAVSAASPPSPSTPSSSDSHAAHAHLSMDYNHIPTTIFTPMEYGCVGLSEEGAKEAYGAEGYEVYHAAYDTLELTVAHRNDASGVPLPPQCYTKVITTREPGAGAAADPHSAAARQRIIGIHVLGPNAGEVIQGFATAVRMGATKADLDTTIGIHPTHAEEVVGLDKTKRSGVSYIKTSC